MKDPLARKPLSGDLGQALSLKVPGQGIGPIPGRETVPPKLGVMGEPISNPQQGLGILVPRSNIAQPDPVVRMFNDAGMNAPAVSHRRRTIAPGGRISKTGECAEKLAD